MSRNVRRGGQTMYKVKINELTLESFRKFGSFANMLNPDVPKIGAAPVEFFVI
jgi:hypothetical protein